MRKLVIAAVALSAVATLAPMPAHAGHCNNVYFFSQPVAVVEHNAVLCTADGTEDTEARVFIPGSTGFQVRYTQDLGVDVPFVYANLSGALVPPNKARIKLNRVDNTGLGNFLYDSATVGFQGGRTGMGCVTATIEVQDDELNSNTYRTVGATC